MALASDWVPIGDGRARTWLRVRIAQRKPASSRRTPVACAKERGVGVGLGDVSSVGDRVGAGFDGLCEWRKARERELGPCEQGEETTVGFLTQGEEAREGERSVRERDRKF
ncbi:hypothetical protein KFK09_002047 [Dendrobium nobile]|uniref:Uncharacterized protein n=1 Tax=Dendrobium nobile TaxID=94219 RepID=A0A8T3CCN8_DENNO|nr:hypothetical protein KFK09_002047 [Dendrobium nobile]